MQQEDGQLLGLSMFAVEMPEWQGLLPLGSASANYTLRIAGRFAVSWGFAADSRFSSKSHVVQLRLKLPHVWQLVDVRAHIYALRAPIIYTVVWMQDKCPTATGRQRRRQAMPRGTRLPSASRRGQPLPGTL